MSAAILTAVTELVRFCSRLGVGVLESVPSFVNYPHNDPLYQGNHWNHPFQNRALAEADVILVIDSDVPWIPTVSRPRDVAAIYHIDVDPLKESMPLWYIKARQSFEADAATALRQLNAHLDRRRRSTSEAAERRRRHFAERHRERTAELDRREAADGDVITPEYLTACVRRQIGGEAIVLNEGITNYPAICDHIARAKPGTIFASGGGSLGWNGGAAIGMKLAAPEKTVVALTGDGSYMFSVPSDRALDGAPLQHAVPAGRLQQPRLEGAEVLGARRPSRRLRQPRQGSRRELRSAAGLFRRRRCGRRRLRPGGQASARCRGRSSLRV